jgi:hypothetical protein
VKLLIIATLIMILATLSAPCYADNWTITDTAYQSIYSTLHVIDWGQTLYISKHKSSTSYYETNPIIGSHPSHDAVNLYFAGTLAGHAIVSYLLPKGYRRVWQCITIVIEAKTTVHNYNMGIKMEF